jgi:hypothetical protein
MKTKTEKIKIVRAKYNGNSSVNPALKRHRQEDLKFKATLDYIARAYLKVGWVKLVL